LNVKEKKRWVRPYLRCYLSLVDDDRRCVLDDSPLLRHLITRVEELIEIGTVSFERLVKLLRQDVEGRLDDVVLVEVGSIVAGVLLLHATVLEPDMWSDISDVSDLSVLGWIYLTWSEWQGSETRLKARYV
jgi:hypothetical protein